jgi:hypothetical protein
MSIFDNLTMSQLLPPNPTDRRQAKNAFPAFPAVPGAESQAPVAAPNSNVSKILPLTTLRTIDLRGKKKSGPLFSRFCAKTRAFFEVICAPEYVQTNRLGWPSPIALKPNLGKFDGTLPVAYLRNSVDPIHAHQEA